MSRTEQRDHLFTSLGMLLAPLRSLVYSDKEVSSQIPFVRVRFKSEADVFGKELDAYCRNEFGYFQTEYREVRRLIHSCMDMVAQSQDLRSESSRNDFEMRFRSVQAAIRQIPYDFSALGIDRGSPFQGYLAIRALCAAAGNQLEIFDPYLGPDVFHRYLSQTNPAVSVTLITEEKRMKGKAGQEIASVSQLFAAERPTSYRLLVDSSLHDRHIRCDGKIFHVGGTFKDVGSKDPCSITPADSPSIAATLDGHIAAATEWFGPTQTIHKS